MPLHRRGERPPNTTRAVSVSLPCVASWTSPGEDELAEAIRKIHVEHRGAYGAPRVPATLRRKGRRLIRKKVERIISERDIRGITRRKRAATSPRPTARPPRPRT
ncbi:MULTISPECIES: transposase [unclassified Streptomyces]|uniref:transposase n=1 Tax=unclassified Streptomyces TaxID=2593676 RepID=UPI00386BDE95